MPREEITVEKLMYLVRLAEPVTPEQVRTTMLDEVAPRLLALDPTGLSMDLDDVDAQVPPPLPQPEDEAPVRALVSIWLPRLDDRGPYEAALGEVADDLAGYLVTESLYTDYGDSPWAEPRSWADGERSPFVLTCSFFEQKAGTTPEEWLERWQTRISPITAELQPRARYVRNAVVRPVTSGAPPYAGLVEEAWPSGEHITDPMRFYNADGDPERMQANLATMLEEIGAFLDLDRMRNATMSEWLLRTPPWLPSPR